MKKTTKKKKPSVRKTILDIVPIRSISEKGYYNMDDGSYMDLLQIQSKDLINSSEDEVEYDCLKFAKLYRLHVLIFRVIIPNRKGFWNTKLKARKIQFLRSSYRKS